MGRVIKLHIFSWIIFLLLVGCKNTGHVFLENDTNEIIVVNVYFLNKSGEQIMETIIQPDDSDGWSYEIDVNESKEIDKKFRKLIITNNKGCKAELNRDEINKLASQSGAWKLSIDKSIMNCK